MAKTEPNIPTTSPSDLEPVVNRIVDQKLARIEQQFHYSGPIPPPDLLERFDRVLPGLAARIVAMAEAEGDHRRKIEKEMNDACYLDATRERTERRIGQVFGLLIGTVAIVAGAIVSIKGQPWAGGFIGGGPLVGLVTAFIYGRSKAHEEEREAERPNKE